MSRFGEGDGDEDFPNQWLLYEQATRNALHGRKAKTLLAEFVQALEAMPQRRLIAGYLVKDGDVCSVAAHATYRRMQADNLPWKQAAEALERDLFGGQLRVEAMAASKAIHAWVDEDEEDDRYTTMDLATTIGWQRCLGYLLGSQNDDDLSAYTPEERWGYVHLWAQVQCGQATRGDLDAYDRPIHARISREEAVRWAERRKEYDRGQRGRDHDYRAAIYWRGVLALASAGGIA